MSSRKRLLQRAEDDLVNIVDQTMEKMREEVRMKFDSIASPEPSQPTNNSEEIVQRGRALAYNSARKAAQQVRSESLHPPGKKKKALEKRAEFLNLNVCKMVKSRKRGFVRKGGYVEVRVRKDARYSDVAENSLQELLSVEEDSSSDEEGNPVLVRANGSVIPNKPVSGAYWDIQSYMGQFNSFNKSGIPVKLGVAIISKHNSHQSKDSSTVSSSLQVSKSKGEPSLSSEPQTIDQTSPQDQIEVLYAPVIGGVGLDIDALATREEVFSEVMSDFEEEIDASTPFIPEKEYYQVASVSHNDGEKLLTVDAFGVYTVTNDKSGVFEIAYQSPSAVWCDGIHAVPLYCICFGHRIEFKFTWTMSGNELEYNSAVVWVKNPGLYRCRVTHHFTQMECLSSLITVQKGGPSYSQTQGQVVEEEVVATEKVVNEEKVITEVAMVKGGVMVYPYKELEDATCNFSASNKIGVGGFGTVYKGYLRDVSVAVKILSEHGTELLRSKSSTQLHTEVATLSRFRHPNIVPFMGYCSQPPTLVMNFMEGGSLYKRLHKWKMSCALTWNERVAILLGSAKGISYLHSSDPPVVHHDINTSNILLDEHLTPKIGDFGFSIQVPQESCSKTLITVGPGQGIPGTPGYRAPEYNDGRYSVKSDVYSYGVVVLETFTGLIAFSDCRSDNNLVDYCEEDFHSDEQLIAIRDLKADGECSRYVPTFRQVITMCVKRSPSKRPLMKEVTKLWEPLRDCQAKSSIDLTE